MGINSFTAALATGVCVIAMATPAHAQERVFNIPAGSLRSALDAFSRQAGKPILYRPDDVRGARSGGFRGSATPTAALTALLAGTGLTMKVDSSGALAVAKSSPQAKSSGSGEATAGSAAADETGAEIVVTGTNIRGAAPVGSKVLTFDRKAIEATGASSAPEFFETLPQNFALVGRDGFGGGLDNLPGTSGNTTLRGSSLNLRGVGQGTTLTLLNGRRLPSSIGFSAVDISAIPLSALQRIEVLTDGASAIYGSDAIGGVVNLVLREDFEGAETSLRYGTSKVSNDYQLAQTVGAKWRSGNILLSIQHLHQDRLRADDRSFSAGTDLTDLTPRENQYSAILVGRQELGTSVTLFGNAFWTKRSTEFDGLRSQQYHDEGRSRQLGGSAGLKWRPFGDWEIEAAGTATSVKTRQEIFSIIDPDFDPDGSTGIVDTRSNLYDISVKADGSLIELPGGRVKLAVGAAWRKETIDNRSVSDGFLLNDLQNHQTVKSLFFETYVPIIGEGNGGDFVRRLEFSIAGRYDDYSLFGSSFDPKFGVSLTTFDGLKLRASYGTSFKAPDLQAYTVASNFAFAETRANPLVPGQILSIISLIGNSTGLKPQTADVFSAGFDYKPSFARGLSLSATYYSINYKDRIAAPPQSRSTILNNPSPFQSIITNNPTASQIAAAIAVGQLGQGLFDFGSPAGTYLTRVDRIFDLRTQNISSTKTDGLDVQVDWAIPTKAGNFSLGFNLNYIFDLKNALTPNSQPFSGINGVYVPTDLRVRGSASYSTGAFSGNIFLNYLPSYSDNRDAAGRKISSYTTIDARLAVRFGKREGDERSGFELALAAQNLFDSAPPLVLIRNANDGGGFDPTNASPVGRHVSLELRKRW